MAEIRVGFSGWTYPPWRGVFYPPKLKAREELAYASRKVNSIEINGTFYRLQKPENYQLWYDETPDDFRFAVKANQFITHRKRLKDAMQPLANFFASGLLGLKEKLQTILWQLPPNLPMIDDRFEQFMKELPHDFKAARALAKKHDAFVEGRSLVDVRGEFPIRHAFEFRHSSFKDGDFLAMMRQNNIGLVIADAGEHSLGVSDVTADHVYVRMHGQGDEYENGYTDAALKTIAKRVRAWSEGKGASASEKLLLPPSSPKAVPVSVYFDNDAKGHAPRDAMRLTELLGL